MGGYLRKYYNEFQNYLNHFDKDQALAFSLGLLSEKKIKVQDLYEEILTPALNSIAIERSDEYTCIWQEHTKTNIVRSIVECAYPYVQMEREKNKRDESPQKIMILCPEEEYHEMGARIGADFFTINDYDVLFIGCNTPKDNFISAFYTLQPDIIAISITNYLNLVSLKKIIAELREEIGNSTMILISGSALTHTMKTAKDFGADALVNTYKEIKDLGRTRHETSI